MCSSRLFRRQDTNSRVSFPPFLFLGLSGFLVEFSTAVLAFTANLLGICAVVNVCENSSRCFLIESISSIVAERLALLLVDEVMDLPICLLFLLSNCVVVLLLYVDACCIPLTRSTWGNSVTCFVFHSKRKTLQLSTWFDWPYLLRQQQSAYSTLLVSLNSDAQSTVLVTCVVRQFCDRAKQRIPGLSWKKQRRWRVFVPMSDEMRVVAPPRANAGGYITTIVLIVRECIIRDWDILSQH